MRQTIHRSIQLGAIWPARARVYMTDDRDKAVDRKSRWFAIGTTVSVMSSAFAAFAPGPDLRTVGTVLTTFASFASMVLLVLMWLESRTASGRQGSLGRGGATVFSIASLSLAPIVFMISLVLLNVFLNPAASPLLFGGLFLLALLPAGLSLFLLYQVCLAAK